VSYLKSTLFWSNYFIAYVDRFLNLAVINKFVKPLVVKFVYDSNPCVKTQSKEQQKVLDVRFCHEKLKIYLFIAI
jgi:hypothetical protein